MEQYKLLDQRGERELQEHFCAHVRQMGNPRQLLFPAPGEVSV